MLNVSLWEWRVLMASVLARTHPLSELQHWCHLKTKHHTEEMFIQPGLYTDNQTQERGVYNQDKSTLSDTYHESIRKLLRNSPCTSEPCSSAPVLGPIRMTNNYNMWEVSVLSVYLAIVSAEIHYLRAICVSGPIKSKQLKACVNNTNNFT